MEVFTLSSPPFSYEYINRYNGRMSPTGEMKYDLTTGYFFRALYERAMTVFKWTLPEDWNRQYFINVLFGAGYIGVIKTVEYGVIPQICTLSGYGLYLQPTRLLVAQPLVNFDGAIGEDCEVIKLTPYYLGITDIIDHYADLLSTACTSLHMALYNSRLAWIAAAKNKSAAETLKVILERVSSGEPAVVVDKLLKDDSLDGKSEPIFSEVFDSSKSYVVHDILEDMRTIITDFDREIGIPVVDDKKERRIETEVLSLTSDAGQRVDTWESCLDESVKRVNRLFNLSISFERKKVEPDVADTTDDFNRSV